VSDYFTNHFCGECMDYSDGGCSEKCCPCSASSMACSHFRKARDFDSASADKKEAAK